MHPPPLSDFLLKLGMAYSEHQGERRTRPRAELQEGVEAHATAWASAIRLCPRRLSGVRAAQAAASAPPLLSTASPPGMRGELPPGNGELWEKGGKGESEGMAGRVERPLASTPLPPSRWINIFTE